MEQEEEVEEMVEEVVEEVAVGEVEEAQESILELGVVSIVVLV